MSEKCEKCLTYDKYIEKPSNLLLSFSPHTSSAIQPTYEHACSSDFLYLNGVPRTSSPEAPLNNRRDIMRANYHGAVYYDQVVFEGVKVPLLGKNKNKEVALRAFNATLCSMR